MTNGSQPVVVTGNADALDDLLDRLLLAAGDGASVDLLVPRDSSLLLTASEFRRLRDAIDRARLAVTLRSDDPLRGQLAGLLGIPSGPIPDELRVRLQQAAAQSSPPARVEDHKHLVDGGERFAPSSPPVSETEHGGRGPAAHPTPADTPTATVPTATHLTLKPEDRVVSVEVGAETATPAPARDSDGARSARDIPAPGLAPVPADLWPEGPVVAPEPPRRRPKRLGRRYSAEASGGGIHLETEPLAQPSAPVVPGVTVEEVAARRNSRSVSRWIGFLVGGVTLVVLAILAVALLMPRVTVAVTLDRVPVQGELVYALVPGEADAAGDVLALPATPLTIQVTAEGSVPTTGRRREPDGSATAAVLFANPNAEPVTVEAGTTLDSLGGPDFTVVSPVEVPAADPATGAPGRAEGEARAAKPGSGGNVDIGEIGGQLESGVYYSNRTVAAEGGTDREVPVVAEADIAALEETAEAALKEEALAEARESLPEGAELLPEAAVVLSQEATPGATVGEEVEAVSVTASGTVQVLAYDPDGLEAALRRRASEVVPAPDGRVVDPVSVRFGTPELEAAAAEGLRFRVPVEADATIPFGPSERRALAERLAGGDAHAAEALLDEIEGLTDWRVDYTPGWLPGRIPVDPDRIEIEVEG